MGKITVKHYLNTNLKPYEMDGEKLYKLYFLLRYNNKNTKIKSLVNEEMTEAEYNERILDNNDILNIRMKNETAFVEKLIEITEKTNLPFEMKLFNDIWQIATYPIIEKFDEYIKWVTYRLGNHGKINFYEQLNIEAYCEVLNSLKIFVNKSSSSISDELYLLQFFDKEIIKEYKKGLPKKEAKKRLYRRETNVTDKIIETEFVPYEIENIQVIKDCIFGSEYKLPFFYHCPKIEKTGNFEIDRSYYTSLFNLVSGE